MLGRFKGHLMDILIQYISKNLMFGIEKANKKTKSMMKLFELSYIEDNSQNGEMLDFKEDHAILDDFQYSFLVIVQTNIKL